MAKGSNVRITDEAHALLAEKAEHLGATMKEVASETIFFMFSKERAQKDCMGLIEKSKEIAEKACSELIERKKRDNIRFAFGLFVLGAIAAGCLGFAVGATL